MEFKVRQGHTGGMTKRDLEKEVSLIIVSPNAPDLGNAAAELLRRRLQEARGVNIFFEGSIAGDMMGLTDDELADKFLGKGVMTDLYITTLPESRGGMYKSEELEAVLTVKMKESIGHFIFKKTDGNLREAFGTLNMDLVPEEHKKFKGTESDKKEKAVLNYYDLEKRAWRALHSGNLIRVF